MSKKHHLPWYSVYLLFAVIIFLFYGNTLFNGFVYDDVTLVESNIQLRDIHNLPKIFTSCLTGDSSKDCQTMGVYYHPFLFLQMMLIYQISDQVWFFHLANLVVLFISSILIYSLFQALALNKLSSILATTLVLVNPINSEIGNLVTAVNDQYLAIFFMLCFLSYIKFSAKGKLKYLFLSGLFYFLALIAKESAGFLLLVIFIYDLIFKKMKINRKTAIKYLKIFPFYLVPILIYSLIRIVVLGRVVHQLPGYHDLSLISQILTSIAIYPRYIIKLFYPLPLNAQHDPPLVYTLSWKVFAAIIFWVTNLYLLLVAIKKRLNISVLGFSLIYLSLLPILIFINKVGRFILSERWLFVATIGWSLMVVDLYPRLLNQFKVRKSSFKYVIIVSFAVYFIASWYVVFNRNKDWHNELNFNKSIADLTTTNFGAPYNLGVNYSNIGDYDMAAKAYQKSITINADFWQARNNLANTYLKLGQLRLAEGEYKKTLKINPNDKVAQNALNNFSLIKLSSSSAAFKNSSFINYSAKYSILSFSLPYYWSINEGQSREIIIKDPTEEFTIQITPDQKLNQISVANYLKELKEDYGVLTNQGLAQIPNFNPAYVNIWDDHGVKKLQFYLFKDSRVVKILVYPADSAYIKEFNGLLSSVSLNE